MIFIFFTVAAAITLAMASVLIHNECLHILDRVVDSFSTHRRRLVMTMFGLLVAHILEIWLYAGAYLALAQLPSVGAIHMTMPEMTLTALDAVYYSAMVYTTVGFGDMVPSGGLRLITATEALVGLSLITWSASFTYLQMQGHLGSNQGSE
jgi:hypothetical protein